MSQEVPSLLLGANMAETRENSIPQAAVVAIPEVFPDCRETGSEARLVAAPGTHGISDRVAGRGSGGAGSGHRRRIGRVSCIAPRSLRQRRRSVLRLRLYLGPIRLVRRVRQ